MKYYDTNHVIIGNEKFIDICLDKITLNMETYYYGNSDLYYHLLSGVLIRYIHMYSNAYDIAEHILNKISCCKCKHIIIYYNTIFKDFLKDYTWFSFTELFEILNKTGITYTFPILSPFSLDDKVYRYFLNNTKDIVKNTRLNV